MNCLRKWALPLATGLAVLAAVLLPRQISAMRDLSMLGNVHTEPLTEDFMTREVTLAEKVELLGRAVQDPDLEIYSTTKSLEDQESGQGTSPSEIFFQSVEYLVDWGVLPENFDRQSLKYQGGSRAIYVQADGNLSVSVLYLQGDSANRDNFWMVVDEETGLPVWIDCTLRSVKEKLPPAEIVGESFFHGLGLEVQQRGSTMWEVEGTSGLVYGAQTDQNYKRISVNPVGFTWELFGEEPGISIAQSK